MEILDIFNNSAFDLISLTTSINKLPEMPSKLGDMGLFEAKSMTTTTATIEEKQGVLSLVESSPRGTRGKEAAHAKRKLRAVPIPHIQQDDEVLADALQGIRDFGENTVMMQVANVVNDRLQSIKNNIDATREYQRCGALNGVVLDADGTTELANLFTLFGVSQTTHQMDFRATPATKLKTQVTAVRRLIEHGMGGTAWSGINIVCGDNFWDFFISCAEIEKAYINWASNEMLQKLQRGGFFFQEATWWNYSTKVGSDFLIPADYAFAFPTGCPGFFLEYFAPADYNETVNTLAQPYYAKQERQRFDKGIDIQGQSNCLSICTRPANVIKLDCLHD